MEKNQNKIENQIIEVCREMNCRLYLLERDKNRLRIFIDKMDKPVNLLECEKISKRISFFLMAENLGRNLELEISSPGVNKKLKYPWHFNEVVGKKIDLTTISSINGRKFFFGVLKQVGRESIYIENESQILEIYFKNIKTARLHFEFSKKLNKQK